MHECVKVINNSFRVLVTTLTLSKTKAERLAWEFLESKGLKNKFTTICPGGVFGDALDKKGGTSIEYVRQFLKGKFPAAPKWGVLISDVKDIAKAHVACIGKEIVFCSLLLQNI